MGERRKRKSLWDQEAETKPIPGTSDRDHDHWRRKDHHSSQDSEHYHEISASGSHGAPKFRDHSSQPSVESIGQDPVAQMNGSFIKSRENVPEGKENNYYQKMSPGLEYNQSLDNDQTHSGRYSGRGRSSSKSRSRTRGRCRSRSLSRGRERESERGRSRSRSRSRSEGDARGRKGSRSPLGDNKQQSSGWSDRRSQPEKSTQICSDVASERCRRGTQCKYYHPTNTIQRDGDLGGADTSEAWRSRACHGNNSKKSYGRGHTEAPDEQYKNRSKGNPLCKYFAAGKCDQDNCRFSHEDAKINSLEGGHDKVINDRGSCEKDNKRNRPTWDDAGISSVDMRPSGRSNSAVIVTDSNADNSNAGYSSRWSHSLGNENRHWVLPQKAENLVDNDRDPVRSVGMGNYSGYVGNTDGNMNVQGQSKFQVDQGFSVNAGQQNVSPVLHIQQPNYGVVENNLVSSFHSNVLDEVKDRRNATTVLLSGQNLHQNGENVIPGQSSISQEAGSEQISALNGAELHQITNLDLQCLIKKHQNSTEMTAMSHSNPSQSFPSLMTNEHSAQYTITPLSTALHQVSPMTNYVMFPNQRFENEHSTGMVLSLSNASGHVPLDSTAYMQLNRMENGRSNIERGSSIGLDNLEVDHSGRSKLQQETAPKNPESDEVKRGITQESKVVQNSMHSETVDGHVKTDERNANKDDEETMRLFKNSLIEFVKDILKLTWKEGRMSREVHKTIVKKVVDKITSTIQTDHIPKTQDKVEQYLSFSKPKIAKLVQAYVDRCLKADS